MEKDFEKGQWNWMMEYCRKNHIPAAQPWAWERALKAHNTYKNIHNSQ